MSKKVMIGPRPKAPLPETPPEVSRPDPEQVERWIQGQAAVAAVVEAPAPVPAAAPVVAAPKPEPKVLKVRKKSEEPVAGEKMKRLTIDIPDSLHRRVKSRCGEEGLQMADVIRGFLEKRFPRT